MRSLFFELPQQLQGVSIITLLPHNSTKEDKPIWGLTSNRLFSTGSMYNILRDQGNRHHTQRNFTMAWRANTPNKIKTFLWLMPYNRLPTNAYLSHISFFIPPHCHLCHDQEETIDHIFFQCLNATLFWDKLVQQSHFKPNQIRSTIKAANWENEWQQLKGKAFNSWLTWYTLLPHCLWVI